VAELEQRWDAEDAYRRFAPAVLAYLRAASPFGHEDLFGEVFVNVARGIGRFRGDEDGLRRWLFTIAQNRVRDEHRRRSRRPAAGPLVPERAAPASPEPFDAELLAALAALTDEQREVVSLRFIADLSLDDVASMTERSVGAVKAMQHRALEALAAAIEGRPPVADEAASVPWQH